MRPTQKRPANPLGRACSVIKVAAGNARRDRCDFNGSRGGCQIPATVLRASPVATRRGPICAVARRETPARSPRGDAFGFIAGIRNRVPPARYGHAHRGRAPSLESRGAMVSKQQRTICAANLGSNAPRIAKRAQTGLSSERESRTLAAWSIRSVSLCRGDSVGFQRRAAAPVVQGRPTYKALLLKPPVRRPLIRRPPLR
jgi:hypothetical protein